LQAHWRPRRGAWGARASGGRRPGRRGAVPAGDAAGSRTRPPDAVRKSTGCWPAGWPTSTWILIPRLSSWSATCYADRARDPGRVVAPTGGCSSRGRRCAPTRRRTASLIQAGPAGGHLRRSWRPVCVGRRALNLTAVALRPRRPLPCWMASIPLACAARYARAQVAWDRVVSPRPQGSPWRRPLARGGGGSVAMVRRWFGPQGHQGTAVVPSLVATAGLRRGTSTGTAWSWPTAPGSPT
jgi:hypothetical protein